MKYNLLEDYKHFLIKSKGFSASTAKTYYSSLDALLKGQSLINTIDVDKVIKKLSEINYKNYFSKSKNTFLYFLEFQNLSLSLEQKSKIKQLENNTKKKYRKLHEIDLKKMKNTINHLKNKKLKVSYLVMLDTGLRVSELSQIKKQDVNISNERIELSFIAKGGKPQKVKIVKKENNLLYESLKDLAENTGETHNVFYSSGYLQNQATKYGFACHDLRRACAKLEYKKTKSKQAVKNKLRHSKLKTTNIYLKSKVKFEE